MYNQSLSISYFSTKVELVSGGKLLSLLPVFELGFWNAWVLIIFLFLIDIGLSSLVIRLVLGRTKYQESSQRHSERPELSSREKKIDQLSTIILVPLIVYSIALPLKLGTGWFIFGFIIYVLSLLFGFVAMINFAQAPLNQPATKGAYVFSRNPMYFSMNLVFVGVSLACESWLFMLLTMIWFVLVDWGVRAEERLCLEIYGDSYRKYMNRTPRWIGIPKSSEK